MTTHLAVATTPASSHRFSSALSLLNLFHSPTTPTRPQTFLYSPSPTATSFRVDSPVLPHSPLETPYRNPIVRISSSDDNHRTTFLYSPSEAPFQSPLSRWTSSPTIVVGPSPLLTTYRVSVRDRGTDSDTGSEDEHYSAGWDVGAADGQNQSNEDTEPLVVARELELPHIGEDDFPYYPETAELPFIDPDEKVEEKNKGRLRRVGRKLCKRVSSKELSLKKWVKKGLLKARLRGVHRA